MALSVIWTGANIDVGYEITLDTTNGNVNGTKFPAGTRIATLDMKNNLERIYGFDSRDAKAIISKKFEGAVSIDTVAYNSDIVKRFFGITEDYFSKPIVVYYNGESYGRLLDSVVPTSAELTVAEDELIRVSFDGLYVSESTTTLANALADVSTVHYPTNVNASISASGFGVDDVHVKSFTLRSNLNTELKWGFHSRNAQAIIPKGREHELTITAIMQKSVYDAFSNTISAPVNITLTVYDETGTAFLTVTANNCRIEQLSTPHEPNTELEVTITAYAESISIT